MVDAFGVPGPEHTAYYAEVARSAAGRGYKERLLTALDLRPGQTVLDVGCGPGTDLADMAAAVTASGSVIGVDIQLAMVDEARRRLTGSRQVDVRVGDAHALPVADRSVHRARADRVIQHVGDPSAVFAEFHRVLLPGGLVCVAEPDWDTLVVDPGDPETTRAFNRFVCTSIVRNATIGRQLPRLAEQAGLDVAAIHTSTPVFRDFELADKLLGFSRNAERAVRAGFLDPISVRRWLADMSDGPFFATSLMLLVVARKR